MTNEFVTWPASRIAPLIHFNDMRPAAALFRAPSMQVRPSAVRPPARRWAGRVFSEPSGGFWTFSWRAGYTADEFVAELFRRAPQVHVMYDGWLLDPEPDALVLVLDSPTAAAAALRRYPHGDGRELNFEALAMAGFAGVHVPVGAPTGLLGSRVWNPGTTCWLRWVFPSVPASPWRRRSSRKEVRV